MEIYLDNAATTRVCPEAAEIALRVMTEDYGNPGSTHGPGRRARELLDAARKQAAAPLGCRDSEIVFTSGGTESDNTALKSVWESRRKQGRHIITSSVEHPAILECCRWLERQGAEVTYLPVSPDGKVSPEALRAALRDDTVLVSIMHVNNESGAVMPVEAFREVLRETGSGALLHCDAVQSWGKLPIDVRKLGADMLSLSAHKVHGPKGVGVLYVREGLHIPVFMHGGGQESGFRSGTENTAGIAGMGKAAELLTAELPERAAKMAALRARLLSGIRERIPDIKVNGPDDAVCSVLNVSFLGCRGEVLLHTLDESGVCVSTGSACSSHSKGSHVLSAMGLSPEEIQGAVRFSLSEENTEEEIDYALEKLEAAVMMQRRLAGFRKGRR